MFFMSLCRARDILHRLFLVTLNEGIFFGLLTDYNSGISIRSFDEKNLVLFRWNGVTY